MKLFLTSAGLNNDSIKKAFFELAGRPAKEIKIVYIPTAANVETGDKWWLINDLTALQSLGFAQLDIVDIASVPKKVWQSRIEESDVIYFGGGNTFFLLYWITKSGLVEVLPELLQSRICVGVSAGSIVLGQGILNDADRKLAKDVLHEDIGTKGLGYVNFSLKPHFLSPLFGDRDEASVAKEARRYKETLYAIDDNTAVAINGDNIKIITEGKWKKY